MYYKKIIAKTIKGKEYFFSSKNAFLCSEKNAQNYCKILNDKKYNINNDDEYYFIYDNDSYYNEIITQVITHYKENIYIKKV